MKWLTLLLFLLPSAANAKRFDLQTLNVAPYLKGDIGTSSANQNVFYKSSGAAEFQEKVRFQYGGEIGVLLTSKKAGLRLGVLILSPQKMDAIEGKDAGGTPLFNLTSTVLGVFPIAHFEMSPHVDSSKRVFISIGGGIGSITFLNDYKFTAAGTSTYSMVDFVEEGKANATLIDAGAGFEFLLTDNVTMLMNGGYRHMAVGDYKHMRDATTFQGGVAKGDTVKNYDDSKRQLNLSSTYIGLGLRFYINY